MKWQTETRKLNELSKWNKNPRKITKKQAEQLAQSIGKFGLCQPIVVNADGTIIGGHQRFAILKKLRYESVDVTFPDCQLTEEEASELALRLNKNGGEWDYDILANQFDVEDLLAVGWECEDLGLAVDPLADSNQEKKTPCKMTITFQSVDDLQEAENKISAIVDTYPGAFYKVKIN